jgi:succinyl-CoA synthetase beta subunit
VQLHEYQAKDILKDFKIPIPKGYVASSADECVKFFKNIGTKCVLKAQVHAGGRGKAGGIKLASDIEEVQEIAITMIGSTLKTFQSAGVEFPINKIYVEEASNVTNELYLAVTMDFEMQCPVIIFSTEGGMNIEDVAENSPEKINKIYVDPLIGPSPYKIRDICKDLKFDKSLSRQLSAIINNIYNLFDKLDCSLVEINPLAIINSNDLLALDAKITIDDDSMFRHPDLASLFDETQINSSELSAQKNDLSYIKLFGGQIGCMVNGAGLAMATMDITMKAGMAPANFLDVGGSANEDRIKEAYQIICSDNEVKLILVNLFGGILRCDVAAAGIVAGSKNLTNNIPMVAVLRGTNSSEARLILEESKLDITFAEDLPDAAIKINEKMGGK